MDYQNNYGVTQVFASALAECFAAALTQKMVDPWQIKVLESPDLPASQGQPLRLRLTVGGASLHGECFVEFNQTHVAEIASKILGTPLSPFSDEHAQALTTVISSAMPELSSSLAAAYGLLTFQVDRFEDGVSSGMFVVSLAASTGEQSNIPVSLHFDGQLLEGLSALAAVLPSTHAENAPIDPINLKLVMDVELNVSLRFGQRQLPLREVLELTSGSVIELDRQVDDPVELLLDGKVIARGEAVIVDGNYGLRITEIPQPMVTHFVPRSGGSEITSGK
jgi:flagellar motor switch protein FliN/FliY